MKYLMVAAALAATSYAWAPSCAWNDCMGSWDGTTCDQSNGWSCLCSNETAIAQLNTCVATSCTNATDQETIYGAVAQLCANNGVQVTASQQATFSATSGGSILAQITDAPNGWGPGTCSPALAHPASLLITPQLVDGTPPTGHLGYLSALLAYPVRLQVGLMVDHGARADGVANGRQDKLAAVGVPEVDGVTAALVLGELKLLESTATHGLHGQEDGDRSPRGPVSGLAAAPPRILPALLQSLRQSHLAESPRY